jgi:hypothetical protein
MSKSFIILHPDITGKLILPATIKLSYIERRKKYEPIQ